VAYGWDFASLEGSEDAVELEFAIDILLLGLDISRSVDLGRHDDEWTRLGITERNGMKCDHRGRYEYLSIRSVERSQVCSVRWSGMKRKGERAGKQSLLIDLATLVRLLGR
jgi:hypothetical protein